MKRWICLLLLMTLVLCGCEKQQLFPFDREAEMEEIAFLIAGHSEEIPVSEQDFEAIAAWLSQFSLGEPVGETLIPGSNQVMVRIQYTDGQIVISGLSVFTRQGTSYYLNAPDAPQVYHRYWEQCIYLLTK